MISTIQLSPIVCAELWPLNNDLTPKKWMLIGEKNNQLAVSRQRLTTNRSLNGELLARKIKLINSQSLLLQGSYVAKLVVVAGLLCWLISSGRLDFSKFSLFFEHQELFICNAVVWAICGLILSGLRWRSLLTSLGVVVPLKRVFMLQAIGLFFNTAVPGAVGGDVVKALYLLKDNPQSSKTPLITSLLLDRFFGLFGLFIMAVFAMALHPASLLRQEHMASLALTTLVIFLGAFFTLLWITARFQHFADPLLRLLRLPIPGFRWGLSFYEALRTFRNHRLTLVKATAYASLAHGLMMLYFWYLVHLVATQPLDFSVFAALYPLGFLSTIIPLAPGGMGVGHTAFDQLFEMVGVQGGANIFNLFIVGQLALNCLGFIPLLIAKKQQASCLSNQPIF